MNATESSLRRRTWLALLCVVWIGLASWTLSGSADAQEAAKQDAAEGAPAAAPHQQSQLMWFIKTSGAIGAFLFLLSMYFVATVGRLFVELRNEVAMPPGIIDQCEEFMKKRDFTGIYNLVKGDRAFFSRLAATGITELPNGLSEAREAMQGVGESVSVEMEKKISMLAVLGTLGPMIGLVGTLKGMIASFSVIAMSDQQMKASQVAEGISEALLLTLEGVGLSVPAIYFYAVFRNRVSQITVGTMLRADEFLRHFAHAARKKAGPGGASPAPAPAAPQT